ncbi:MAG: hypothetical protein Q8M02_13310 [Candidatus Didemnitutus sp.]|nr:hypothetical protein [Candidatus Didemnitutus sp.]
MALKPKNPDQTPNGVQPAASVKADAAVRPGAPAPLELKTNPEIEAKIAEYKAAHPKDVEYISRLVKEHPDRAVNHFFYKEWQRHDADTEAAKRQLPQAKAIYDKMTPESQQRVNDVLQKVNPYNQTKRFVAAVSREMDRVAIGQNRRALRSPANAPAMSAG